MLRIYPAELSCVGGVYAAVGSHDPVYNSVAIGYGCRIVNWVTTADTTQLDFVVGKFVQTRRDCHQLVANSIHTADKTQLDSCVASAVCIG